LTSKPIKDQSFVNSIREAGPYLGLGLQLAVTIVVMVFIGSWLDSEFKFHYIFTLIFGFLGIGIGIYNLIKTVNDLESKNKKKNETG
jgi:F0F1-type ATP synthase assembly protein I